MYLIDSFAKKLRHMFIIGVFSATTGILTAALTPVSSAGVLMLNA